MAKDFAQIKLTLIFHPSEVWQHMSQFDKSFSDYLATIGFEGQVVNVVGGAVAERMLLVSKKEALPGVEEAQETPQKGPQAVLKEMTTKTETKAVQQFKQGKMLWRKGYLKK